MSTVQEGNADKRFQSNEVEACDLAKSRKWKVIQMSVLKGYLLMSSSLTLALVSNTYNLL